MNDKLFNPNYLQSLCAKYGLKPSKKYGQNFLIDPVKSGHRPVFAHGEQFNGVNLDPVEKMIEAAEIKKTDTVIEIGPGFGVLTFALAEKAKKVIAFEIEKKLAPYWAEQIKQFPNITVEWGNMLRELGTVNRELGNSKVVANLPYQITSAVIRAFLEAENPPEKMVLMVQKEVAERICAKPGDMSLMSVSVQYYANPEIIAIVSRSNFWPEPSVDSAIIKITLHSERLRKRDVEVDGRFFRVVKAGFSNRRKLLSKNLESIFGKSRRGEVAEIFSKLGLKTTVRAQELSIEQWKEIAEKLSC